MSCNVPEYDCQPVTLIDEDPAELVEQMIRCLDFMAKAAYRHYYEDESFQPIIDEAEQTIVLAKRVAKDLTKAKLFLKANENDAEARAEVERIGLESMELNRKSWVATQFLKWCRQLPVYGFNSGKFDINLIRPYLFPFLLRQENELDNKPRVIRKGTVYLSIETNRLRFLDMMQFLAPNTSYAKFLKSQQTEGEKSL